jgi:hypothetical protein
MAEVGRTSRFDMTVAVEPGHVAHLGPERAADAAISVLTP